MADLGPSLVDARERAVRREPVARGTEQRIAPSRIAADITTRERSDRISHHAQPAQLGRGGRARRCREFTTPLWELPRCGRVGQVVVASARAHTTPRQAEMALRAMGAARD